MTISNDKFDALLSKLDTLIEQVKLTNAFLGAQASVERLCMDVDWQTSEQGNREYFVPTGVYRIVDDEVN